MGETHSEIVTALRVAQDERPELSALLGFYAELVELQHRAGQGLPRPRLWEPAVQRQRLEGGLPQLTFDCLGIEALAFGSLVGEVASLLKRHSRECDAERSGSAPEALVAQARIVFDTWDTLAPPGAAAQVAVAFALAAYLQRAAAAILPGLDLRPWVRARCPVCGGEPNLAVLDQEGGGRRLICARCDAGWGYVRAGCPFCRSKEAQSYYPSEDGLYRLYVCPSCKRYLKTVDLRAARRPVYRVVERLLMVGMDLAAEQAGYGLQEMGT